MLSIPFYGVPENNLGDLTKLTIISPINYFKIINKYTSFSF
jgi:hypothetical protein